MIKKGRSDRRNSMSSSWGGRGAPVQIQLSRNICSARSEAAEEVKGGIASLDLRRLRDVWERGRSEESPMRRGELSQRSW